MNEMDVSIDRSRRTPTRPRGSPSRRSAGRRERRRGDLPHARRHRPDQGVVEGGGRGHRGARQADRGHRQHPERHRRRRRADEPARAERRHHRRAGRRARQGLRGRRRRDQGPRRAHRRVDQGDRRAHPRACRRRARTRSPRWTAACRTSRRACGSARGRARAEEDPRVVAEVDADGAGHRPRHRRAGARLEAGHDAIDRIAETVQQIAAATAEQARGSEQIMKSAEKMKVDHAARGALAPGAGARRRSRSPARSSRSARWCTT